MHGAACQWENFLEKTCWVPLGAQKFLNFYSSLWEHDCMSETIESTARNPPTHSWNIDEWSWALVHTMDGLKTEVCTMHCGMNGSLTVLFAEWKGCLDCLGQWNPWALNWIEMGRWNPWDLDWNGAMEPMGLWNPLRQGRRRMRQPL